MNSPAQRARRLSLFSHLLWLFLAILLWSGRQFWEWKQGQPFSALIYVKGLILLWLVALIEGEVCRRRPSFLLLGFFPLIWLSVSRIQWDLCSQLDNRYWMWLSIFLLMEFFLFVLRDGRQLFAVVVSLGTVLSMIFPFSLGCFLSFGWVLDNPRLSHSKWVRYGLPLAGISAFFLIKAQLLFHLFWYDLFQVLVNDLFISFFLLGALGVLGLATRRNAWTPALGPWVLLCVGFLFLSGPDYFSPLKQELLKWVLVFFAGFGWESFRRDMMDRTWHGRLLWFLLGFCFLGGVL